MSNHGSNDNGSHKDGGQGNQNRGSHSGSLQNHEKQHHQDAAAHIHQDKAHLNQEKSHLHQDTAHGDHDKADVSEGKAHAEHASVGEEKAKLKNDQTIAGMATLRVPTPTEEASARVAYTDGASSSNGRNPAWWTDSIDDSWKRAKPEVVADWKKTPESEHFPHETLAERALALGHGASESYEKLVTWGGELEAKLRHDWKETGLEAEAAWDKVNTTVKHAWERAAKLAKMAANHSSSTHDGK